MADLTSGVGELERRLAALRSQADQMEHAVGLHPSSPPSTRAWAAPPSPGSPPTAAGLDPNAPDFLARLAELKAQHARNLRELELQLQRGGGRGFGAHSPRSPRSPAPTPSVRPHSAREQRARPDADEAVQRAAELDELLAAARARRPIDTSRLDAARQRWQQRPRSAPPRRPHPRTTVPQPFAFEQRDAERRRELARATSAQRQRRHSEGAATEHYQPFKAQPVPVSTVEPRYERMVARAEQRREQVAAERRKSLEAGAAPFAFLSRPPVPRRRPPVQTQEDLALQHKFKAKPVPANVSMRVYEQMQHEQALRKERVSRQAQEKLAAAALPPRMERHQQMAKVNKVATAGELSGSGGGPGGHEGPFKPRINPISPAIPPFAQMQRRFEHALARKKQSVPPTVAQPFSMYTDKRPNRMERVLRDIERDALVLPEQRWPHVSARAPSNYEPVDLGLPPDSAFRTTLAVELRRASLEDEQELKRAIEAAKRKEDEERIARQKRVAAEVAAVLKPTFVSDEGERERRRKAFIEEQKEKKENWERVKRQIETNVSKRPYLFEQASTAAHVDRARQERLEQFEKTLRENGLGDLIDG